MTTTQHIETILTSEQGKRKQRLLTAREIGQVLTEAMRDGYGYTTGGQVANSYGYPASTTLAFACANGPDYIALKIGTGDARKNSSPVTFAGVKSSREKDCRDFVARSTLYTLRDWIILSRAECKRFIRSIVGIKVPRNLPKVTVTLQDSLNAGNCQSQSMRVAGWFKAPAIQSATLVRTIARREPLLLPFALRAVKQAAIRAEVNA